MNILILALASLGAYVVVRFMVDLTHGLIALVQLRRMVRKMKGGKS